MRAITLLAMLCNAFLVTSAMAGVKPDRAIASTISGPGDNWFITITYAGGYVYDADTGEMQGLLALSPQNPGLEINHKRREIYAPESHYSRAGRGDRADIIAVYDFENLAPVAEIVVPKKLAVLHFRRHVAQMSDGRHIAALNMTPAQSVTIVDVEARAFVGEISTPGCAVMLAVADNGFLMLCGDGTLQLIRLKDDGSEKSRVRSKSFFKVQDDPIYDRQSPTRDGWLLLSHEGKAFDVTVSGDKINIGKPWSILSAKDVEEKWRPGGQEFNSIHQANGLLYVAMHQGERYTHTQYGSEIWVISTDTRNRIARIRMEDPVVSVYVTQSDSPRLIALDDHGSLRIFDAITFREEILIDDAGAFADYIQGF